MAGFKTRHLLLLAAAVTDRTFERVVLAERGAPEPRRGAGAAKPVWVGKCLHCGKKLVVADDGRPISEATLEHVWPETQGGTNDVQNLAVACAGCNREKGARHDHRGGPRLDEVVAVLRARRLERWRDPAEVGMATRLAAVMGTPVEPT